MLLCEYAHELMRLTLPSNPFWILSTIALFSGVFAVSSLRAQGDGEEESEEPIVEVIKQLVFIEQHEYEAGVVDGIRQPYDVKVAPDGGHVYVASQGNSAIGYFSRDEANGELTYSGYVTQSEIGENALGGARSLVISPDGEFVYSVAMFSNSLATFDRNKESGELAFVDAVYDADNGVDGLDGPRSLVMSPDGKNLYVAAYDDNKLSVFSRNSVSGVASFLGVYEEGDQGVEELSAPHALVLSPDGKSLYVALFSNEIIVFDRNASSGLLTYRSRLSYLGGESKKVSIRAMALSPDGKYLYVASWNNDAISVFSRDTETGTITHENDLFDETRGVSNLDGPHAISISSDGAYLYAAASGSHSVTSFERDASTGDLDYYQSVVSTDEDDWEMRGPISIGTSPDGEHVYLGAGSTPHSILTFRREVLVDPPEFVVQPTNQSIEEGETVAFYALAQGVDLSYQWLRDGGAVEGETLPVLTIPSVALSDDDSSFSIRVSNPGGVLTSAAVDLTVLPPIVVNAPVDLTALDISSRSARLVWKDESDNETSFEVQRRVPGGDFSGLVTVLENQIQYDDASLLASTTYIYRVRARKGETVSAWSNDAVIESFDDAPQSPVILSVDEQTYNKVSIRWSDRSAVEDGFRVVRRRDEVGGLWTEVGTLDKNVTVFEDRTVLPLSTYAYRVQAFNESGSSDYSNSVVAITSEIPVDSITPVSRQVSRTATSGYSVNVTSSKQWEAIADVEWLVVTSPTSGLGSGNQGVVYRSLLNESQNSRTGKIVVGGLDHTVVQEGSPPFIRVLPTRTETDADGGTEIVDVESNLDWTATENVDWLSVTSGDSGTDYGSVVLQLLANDSFDSREASLTVSSVSGSVAAKVHTIVQTGKVPRLELSSESTLFTGAGGTGNVSVDANQDWDASVSVSWISLTDAVSGSGEGVVAFSVDANESFDSRTADILVNDQAISITQEPRAGDSPNIEIGAVSDEVKASGETISVDLESNVEWMASESVDWVSISESSSGTGDGAVSLVFSPNDSTVSRDMDLTVTSVSGGIDPQVIRIVQAGNLPYLELASASTRFSEDGGIGSVAIDTNQAWNASVSVSWITLQGVDAGSGGGSVAFSVDEFYAPDSRTADILINDRAISITQDPPLESDVVEPEWVAVAVGPLGAELQWRDLSDDELGFRIRRSVVGASRVFDVVDLPADSTKYFDRDAPRGKRVKYTLVAYDVVGESDEITIESELVPSANMTSVALHLEGALDTKVFEASIPLAGDGEIVLQRESTSEAFSGMTFGSRYPTSRYRLDSDVGGLELLGESASTDWRTYYLFDEAAGGEGFDLTNEHIAYAAYSLTGSSAFPRGARAMGQLLDHESAIVVGFEIEGDIELPVLIQAVGASIDARYGSTRAAGLELRLYEILETDSLSLLESNMDWSTSVNASTVSIEDALARTGGVSALSGDGGEARVLLMLAEGKYVVVLSSATGSVGTVALEVFDAR